MQAPIVASATPAKAIHIAIIAIRTLGIPIERDTMVSEESCILFAYLARKSSVAEMLTETVEFFTVVVVVVLGLCK